MKIVYSYSSENRIINRCSYMYTKFEGEKFFELFFYSRNDSFLKLEKQIHSGDKLTAFSRIIFKKGLETLSDYYKIFDLNMVTHFDSRDLLEKLKERYISCESEHFLKNDIPLSDHNIFCDNLREDSDNVNTINLMYSLLKSFNNNSDENNIFRNEWIDRLIQRFEVTKRLYESYVNGFKKGTGNYDRTVYYSIFSFLLCCHYLKNSNIKYLNTILKLNDLACSVISDVLKNKQSSIALFYSLIFEKIITEQLLIDKGLKICEI